MYPAKDHELAIPDRNDGDPWRTAAKRRVAGWVAGAGIMKMIVSNWIIPENSLRKTHQ